MLLIYETLKMIINILKLAGNRHSTFRALILLLVPILLIVVGCASTTTRKNVDQGLIEKKKIIVFVDIPFQTIDTGSSFYKWIYNAFVDNQKNGFAVIKDRFVLENAKKRGINPIYRYQGTIYEPNNPTEGIAHLAFDEAYIEQLYDMAKEFDADYLIKAKLISNKKRIEKTPQESKTIPLFGSVGLGVTTEGKKESVIETRVEFTVYDVTNRDILLTKVLISTKKRDITEGQKSGTPLDVVVVALAIPLVIAELTFGDILPRNNLVSALFDVISFHGTKSYTKEVMVKKGIYKVIPITLNKVSVVNNDFLQFHLSFRDFHDERLKITLLHRNDKTLDSYIVDKNSIRYRAISSSLPGDSIDVRPEERKDFF